jgi:hypothetical protein
MKKTPLCLVLPICGGALAAVSACSSSPDSGSAAVGVTSQAQVIETVTVTAPRASDADFGDFFHYSGITSFGSNLSFAIGGDGGGESGGGGGDQGTTISPTKDSLGDVTIDVPLLHIKVRIDKASFDKLTPAQKGALFKILTEFEESPTARDALGTIATAQADIVIHFDNLRHFTDGHTESWPSNISASIEYRTVSEDGRSVSGNTRVHINFDPTKIDPTSSDFADALLHELSHIVIPGLDPIAEEGAANTKAAEAYKQIFQRNGVQEGDELDYYNSLSVNGTPQADNLNGGSGNDGIAGGAGNDTLFGSAGNDTLFGGADDDWLGGGSGSWNQMMGGLGNDQYNVSASSSFDMVMDDGGFDVLSLEGVSLYSCQLFRSMNTLLIRRPDGRTVQVDRQWVPQNKIERFAFNGTLFEAAEVENRTIWAPSMPPGSCTLNADCGGSPECGQRVCSQNQCVTVSAVASGTLCNYSGGPEADQCDGNGRCVECVNDGGCDAASYCSNGVCLARQDESPPAPIPDCLSDADCGPAPTECEVNVCSQGQCIAQPSWTGRDCPITIGG